MSIYGETSEGLAPEVSGGSWQRWLGGNLQAAAVNGGHRAHRYAG